MGLTFCQCGKASLALALAAHYRIRFPMSGVQTAVYGLVPPSNQLSLAAQHFQIAVYQILLVDSAVDHAPVGHPGVQAICSGDHVARSFSSM